MPVSDLEHMKALRRCDRRFYAERDRRYSEVADARAEALKIKEAGDALALTLAAENQRLRDVAHNDLLRQWQEDRRHSVTREQFDAVVKPLVDYVASQGGRDTGKLDSRTVLFSVLGLLAAVAIIIAPHVH